MILQIGTGLYEALPVKLSTKSYSRKRDNPMKDVIVSISKALSPVRNATLYNRYKARYESLKNEFRSNLQKLLTQYQNNELTATQFAYHAKAEFRKVYQTAYEYGTNATGLFIDLPKEDLNFITKFRYTEYKYLNKFIADMEAGRGTMDYADRMDMYVNTLDGIFDAGRVDAMPNEGTKIYWILGVAEHCPDCTALADGSPYTPDTLPTTPRSGDTQCLSNCQCHLRIRYDRESVPGATVQPVPPNRGKVIMFGEGVDVIDWNLVDEVKTLMTEFSLKKNKTNYDILDYIDKIRMAQEKLPEWLNPFSNDFDIVHMLGSVIYQQYELT